MINVRPTWAVRVHCTNRETKLLVTEDCDDVLKARLSVTSVTPGHPRALLTLCEGLAMWHGTPLHVAVSADDDAQACIERILYAGALLEPERESLLVEFEHQRPRIRPPRRIQGRGLGDFRQLRLVEDDL